MDRRRREAEHPPRSGRQGIQYCPVVAGELVEVDGVVFAAGLVSAQHVVGAALEQSKILLEAGVLDDRDEVAAGGPAPAVVVDRDRHIGAQRGQADFEALQESAERVPVHGARGTDVGPLGRIGQSRAGGDRMFGVAGAPTPDHDRGTCCGAWGPGLCLDVAGGGWCCGCGGLRVCGDAGGDVGVDDPDDVGDVQGGVEADLVDETETVPTSVPGAHVLAPELCCLGSARMALQGLLEGQIERIEAGPFGVRGELLQHGAVAAGGQDALHHDRRASCQAQHSDITDEIDVVAVGNIGLTQERSPHHILRDDHTVSTLEPQL